MATSKQQQLTRGWSLLGTVMPGFYNQRERPLESNQPFLTYYLFQNSLFFLQIFLFLFETKCQDNFSFRFELSQNTDKGL